MSEDNIAQLFGMLGACSLCPRRCGVDRTAGHVGQCRIGRLARVASAGAHFGEEPPLVGRRGSGTIFLGGCALHCVFCQNQDISQHAAGVETTDDELAALALDLERRGCRNVNFVTPTHVAHAVARAVATARARGLAVPVVYNCGGYESLETLRRLDGLIEIYMPDFKYATAEAGRKYSDVANYPAVAESALAEMYRQVGPLRLDAQGAAVRGVLVRHLVMPGDLADSRRAIEIVARTAPGTTINVMAQYRPCHRAAEFPELAARVDAREVAALRSHARSLGLVLTD